MSLEPPQIDHDDDARARRRRIFFPLCPPLFLFFKFCPLSCSEFYWDAGCEHQEEKERHDAVEC